MSRTIVIGAGAVGLSSAYHLRRQGCDVTVVDPAPLAAKASGHNAGWIIPSMSTPVPAPGMMGQALKWMARPDSPLYVSPSAKPSYMGFLLRMLANCTGPRFQRGSSVLAALSSGALASFDELTADGVEFESHDDPLTMLFTDPHKLEVRVHELELIERHLPGFSWRHMEDDELRRHMPLVSDRVVAAIESQGDRSVDPASLVRGLAEACRRDGVELRLGETARLTQGADGRAAVRTGGETLRADTIVVAAGVWTNDILAGIGERIPLQAGKGYGYDLPPTPGAPTRPMYLAEAKVAVTPLDTKVRLAGAMGFGGIDETVSRRRAGGILSGARTYFQGWPETTAPPEPWVGLRPMTPDGVPVIGPLARHPEVTVATGHAMLGISLAPVTGRLVAELATGAVTPEQLPGVSATRF